MEITKTCTSCKETKELVKFNKNKLGTFGYSYRCKDCQKIYRNLNADRLKENSKLYRNLNRDKWKEYYQKNKQNYSKRAQEYQIINKEKISEREKLYRENNKEAIKKKLENYNFVHKESLKISRKLYCIQSRNNLTDAYIKRIIKYKYKGLKNIPQELIELKRIQIKTERLCQQLKN